MRCPYCKGSDTYVGETKEGKSSIWRRRKCRGCRMVFYTEEVYSDNTAKTAVGYDSYSRREHGNKKA